MAIYQLAWNQLTKVITIQNNGDTLPTGSSRLGSFDHNDSSDTFGNAPENHVFYQHVQDILGKIGQFNMQIVSIILSIANSIPSLALLFSDNTPLQFSDGSYLETAS